MAYLVGVILALSVGLFASFIGLDRDKAFYPSVMIVIASYFALFAVMGVSIHVLALECMVIIAFIAISVIGFRGSLVLVVAGLAAHGVFDLVHSKLITNPGVPVWWPTFCLAYDVTAAAYLTSLLWHFRNREAT